ncbi:MAG TPA: TIGR03086 family metal-binding protein [Mycobacteriales bacterium]|nr:TIGR03086 family metal-binding protein [Mycobacteriales bacterium]
MLERSISYTLGCLHLVTPETMSAPTPCLGWDLRRLLQHMRDSLAALQEAADSGPIGLTPVPAADLSGCRELVATVRGEAGRLLGTWSGPRSDKDVLIAEMPLAACIVTGVGALELTTHAWDIARACRQDRPIPAALAEELLALVPLVVFDAERPARFAPQVAESSMANPSDRLLAFLGRQP